MKLAVLPSASATGEEIRPGSTAGNLPQASSAPTPSMAVAPTDSDSKPRDCLQSHRPQTQSQEPRQDPRFHNQSHRGCRQGWAPVARREAQPRQIWDLRQGGIVHTVRATSPRHCTAPKGCVGATSSEPDASDAAPESTNADMTREEWEFNNSVGSRC